MKINETIRQFLLRTTALVSRTVPLPGCAYW